jgi:hypothetical protein
MNNKTRRELMTDATRQALEGIRDISTLKWYVIPMLALVFYIYTKEMGNARRRNNWDVIYCGLVIFGLDFFNETWNGWLAHLSGYSAAWTTPGETALRVTVGWNIEIIFMFLISGIIYYNTLSENQDKKIFGINEKWFWAGVYTVFCVFIEVILNQADLLIWDYAWWSFSWGGIWPILVFGYGTFFFGAAFLLTLKTDKQKITMISIVYAVPVIMTILAVCLGFVY